ncbi:MAG: IclR family transcriptional regulator, partial [Comamonadaceae bacterium]
RAECKAIVERDHACDNEEFIAGLVAVAVPVRNAAGVVRAAIALHAPTARMSLKRALGRLTALEAAARRMDPLL